MNVKELIRRYGIHKKANYRGFSNELKKKIVGGRETDILAIRIYVKKKVPLHELRAQDIIPREIEGVPTDVIELNPRALSAIDRTDIFRPLKAGVSVGNYEITAGTLSYFFYDAKGAKYLVSNAHVLCSNPSLPPNLISEKRILQPGPSDLQQHGWDKNDPKFLVGHYIWHQQIYPIFGSSTCPIAKGYAGLFNTFSRLLGRKTRLLPILQQTNYIDFAIATLETDWEPSFPTLVMNHRPFIGLLFAGDGTHSIICKGTYILELGYKPLGAQVQAEIQDGDLLIKEGRSSGITRGKILDRSASLIVSYENFEAEFSDVIVSDLDSAPGDSGSSVWG